MTLRAHQLQPGMIVTPTNRKVLRVVRDGLYMRDNSDKPVRGILFPRGKVELMLERPDGRTEIVYWNTYTTVTVKD